MIQQNITTIVSTFTLLSHIVFVVVLFMYFFDRTVSEKISNIVSKFVLEILLLISFSAFVGSLLYSNVVGFPPCELCWIQRILVYPQVLLLFMAVYRKDKNMVTYLLPLSIMGGIVSLYHSLTHFGLGDGVLECTSALGDCGKLYVFEYGYITIPFMAFTIFAYLILVSLIYLRSNKKLI